MTTVAYRAGVLAADTLATWGNSRDGRMIKAVQRGPLLAAVSGALAPAQRFLDWFARGASGEPPEMPDGEHTTFGLIIMPDDLFLIWGPLGWERTRDEFLSMGSGANFASGAMAMGADAERAVAVAALFDTKTGGDVTVLRRTA